MEQSVNEAVAVPDRVSDTPEPDTVALDQLRRLVEGKTRYDGADIQGSERSAHLPFGIQVRYRIFSHLVTQDINGRFQAGSRDRESPDPMGSAIKDDRDPVPDAVTLLTTKLRGTGATYDAIPDGRLLPVMAWYWNLDRCRPCSGAGHTRCTHCGGVGTKGCMVCNGLAWVVCTMCLGGQRNCTVCFGSGSVNYGNGSTPCTACIYGKVQCTNCSGTGRAGCFACARQGRITCGYCTGRGAIDCDRCGATGQFGQAAGFRVDVAAETHLAWGEPVDPVGPVLLTSLGLGPMVEAAGGVTLKEVQSVRTGSDARVVADYAGALPVFQVDARARDTSFQPVAYGQPLRWHTLDGIVEALLDKDLRDLSDALMRAHNEGLLSRRLDDLLAALRNVSASELNHELIEGALNGQPAAQGEPMVAPEYVRDVQAGVLGALRLVYVRTALTLTREVAAGAAVVGLAMWAWLGLGMAVTASLLAAPVGWWWVRRRIRSSLTHALTDASKAQRSMEVVKRSGRDRMAMAIVAVPVVLVSFLLYALLPTFAPWSGRSGPASGATTSTQPPPAAATKAPAGSTLQKALALMEQQPAEARRLLAEAVGRGETQPMGLYAWMLLHGEGADPGSSAVNDQTVLDLVRRALAAHSQEPWALATEGMMLAEGWGMTRNLEGGMDRLTRAGDAGVVPAMHAMGMYQINVKRQPAAAKGWFERAAAQGHRESLYNLGLMEWRGDAGGRVDRERAMQLWKQAAAKGEPRAVKAVRDGKPA